VKGKGNKDKATIEKNGRTLPQKRQEQGLKGKGWEKLGEGRQASDGNGGKNLPEKRYQLGS